MAGVTIRPLRTGEQWLLTEFLYEAVWRPDGAPPVPRTERSEALPAAFFTSVRQPAFARRFFTIV